MLRELTLAIDFHASVGEGALEREAVLALQANRIDPKLLYVTPRQTELWRRVFLGHSPIHGNPEFARIYHEAFSRLNEKLSTRKIVLLGLGCGTGLKELDLYSHLRAAGVQSTFRAIDVSRDLVAESAQRLIRAGAGHERSLVCDLAETAYLADWLDRTGEKTQRLITFFGLVPNLAPSMVARLFRAVLRPEDVVLVSAHLAPIGPGVDLPGAMRKVLPQYGNPETLTWLSAALEEWGLEEKVEAPEMKIGSVEGIPAFVAEARWKSSVPFEKWGERFAPHVDNPLQLFHSLRYTPALFEDFLKREKFQAERLAMTACREEAIWAVRSA
jgi:L-histidine N-alpha-methyltransferase